MTHANVLQKCKEFGWEIPVETAADVNEKNFLEQAKAAKEPITKSITKIVRIKDKKQEYFWYGEEWTSHDNNGNEIQFYNDPIGKYEDPVFRQTIDIQTGEKVATEIIRREKVYELKWPEDFTEDMEERVDEKVDLLVIHLNRKYGGFSFADFRERSFDELVMFGRFGTYNPVIQKELEKEKKGGK